MPIEFLLLGRGGGVLGFFRKGGGGSTNFIFMGTGMFLNSGTLPNGVGNCRWGLGNLVA